MRETIPELFELRKKLHRNAELSGKEGKLVTMHGLEIND